MYFWWGCIRLFSCEAWRGLPLWRNENPPGGGWQRRIGVVVGSDPHGHQDVAGRVFGVGVFGAHLAGGLRVLELEADLAFVSQSLEEVEDVRWS